MGSEYKTITRDGVRKPAHVVLMEEYLGRPLRGNEVVHHINGEKDDNRLANLQVMDRAEHSRLHASGITPNADTLKKLSLSHKGKPSANRKLTREQVQRIAELLKAGVSARKIAEEYSVSGPSIVSIRDGKSYRDFLEGYTDSDFPLQEIKRGRANRTERKLDPKELGFVRIALM
ncbi:MAG: HNH endonuclease [Oscillospiraceae bacterium]|nr:HNH endonuclease [Oscillospiraceae bacterium]